jgi:hypothetical protein
MTPTNKPSIVPPAPADDTPLSIAKPGEFSLDKFRATQPSTIAGVETLVTALPHHPISHAKDFVRLHPDDDNYWSDTYCFVNVPIKGQKRETLHLIAESLALQYLPSGRIQKFRLALACKPDGAFFLCHVPTENLDNPWNSTNLQACKQAKQEWVQATSRRDEGAEGYDIKSARHLDAFAEPKWPQQSLNNLIEVTFAGRMIDREDHPGLLRLIGARQSLS